MARQPLEIEIVTYVTGSLNHCDGWQRVSDWIYELADGYPGQLVIRVTDAQSMQGLWKSLTKGVRKYPTFIIDHQQKYHGWDRDQLKELIDHRLAEQGA